MELTAQRRNQALQGIQGNVLLRTLYTRDSRLTGSHRRSDRALRHLAVSPQVQNIPGHMKLHVVGPFITKLIGLVKISQSGIRRV